MDAGADLIGLNFVPGSRRELDLKTAVAISEQVSGQVERVAIFQDAEEEAIIRVLRRVDLERIQFHGDETPEHCEAFSVPYIKALRMSDGVDVVAERERFSSALAGSSTQ